MSDSPAALLVKSDGTEIATAANPVRVDPTGTTTQPVSGPLTDAQLRATSVPVAGPLTDTQLRASSVPVSGPLTDTQLRATSVPVSDGGGSLTVDGTVAVSGSVGVTGPLTDTQLRASAVPVSAAALPLPSGAATSALQTTGNTSVGNIDTKTPALGQALMAASRPVVIASNQSAVPISGTVTANAGTGPFPVSDNGGSLTVDGTVAVSGSVAVTGPLTDAQLRATAVPVSGSFTSSVIPNPTDTTGTITALNGTVVAAVQGWTSNAIVLTGTWVALLIFEFSHDGGTTWSLGGFVKSSSTTSPIPTLLGSVDTNGSYQTIGMGPTTHVRLRAVSFTSGTINVRMVFSAANPAMQTGFAQIQQNVAIDLTNSSTTNIAAGAAFTGTAKGVLGSSGISVSIASDQPMVLQIQQSSDGTNWDVTDTQSFMAGQGDSRVYQSNTAFYRVVVTNIGNATSTYFRLQTLMYPTVEAMPRALTPAGKLRIASKTDSYYPDPMEAQDNTSHRALLMDVERNLRCRSLVFTDEASFRDDFTAGNVYTDLTGTVYVTNGSDVVTGVGTAFTSEVIIWNYLKISTHDNAYYSNVAEVISDTQLRLESPYEGATDSGTGRIALWHYAIGTGGAITQTSSEILLASGTTSGTLVQAKRYGDYLPYVMAFSARISQRIANQEAHIGFADGDIGAMESQALVVFDGTTNTTCKLRTSFSSGDVQETTLTLPGGALTSATNDYQLEVLATGVSLFINGIKMKTHVRHIPGPYSGMDLHACIKNTGAAASSTTLALDTLFFANYDQVNISTYGKGDPLSVQEARASSAAITSVAAAVTDTTLLVSNFERIGATVTNDSSALLYLKLGTGASSTSHTVQIPRGGYYEVPYGYSGPINGIWTAATGNARITEVLR